MDLFCTLFVHDTQIPFFEYQLINAVQTRLKCIQDEFDPLMMGHKMFPQANRMMLFGDEMIGTSCTSGASATLLRHMIVPTDARNQVFGDWFFGQVIVVVVVVVPTMRNGTTIAMME
jgi:hypothetical protein